MWVRKKFDELWWGGEVLGFTPGIKEEERAHLLMLYAQTETKECKDKPPKVKENLIACYASLI